MSFRKCRECLVEFPVGDANKSDYCFRCRKVLALEAIAMNMEASP